MMVLRSRLFLCAVLAAALFVHLPYAEASHTGTTTKVISEKHAIAIPVLFGVTLADIIPDFGDPRGGGTRTHEGQDIRALEGTPIVTPVKGTVVRHGTAATPGKYVYVRGTDGYTYAYMHLAEIAKLKRGQKLKVGDLIGTVGETGNAQGTTPHLHFEIRKSKPIDPYPRLKKEFTFEEKIEYLNEALRDLKKSDTLAAFMAKHYSGLLMLAETQELTLDKRLKAALGNVEKGTSLASTTTGLRVGSSGESVVALQNALIMANMGPNAFQLAQAGATGYFGNMTAAALREYQLVNGLVVTGVYDEATRTHLIGLAV